MTGNNIVLIVLLSVAEEPDAGWNDPPKFSYGESMQLTNSPKRNLLNKRVAFPMNSTQSTTTSQSNIDPTTTPVFNTNLPPPPMASISLACNKIDDSSKNDDSETVSDNSTVPSSNSSPSNDDVPDLSYILESLTTFIDEKQEALSSFVSIVYSPFKVDNCNLILTGNFLFSRINAK